MNIRSITPTLTPIKQHNMTFAGSATLSDISDASFDREVKQSPIPVLVDFWAPWCGPCKQLTPTVQKLADDYQGKVKVVKVNIDANPNTARAYGISSIPTLLLFKNGQVVDKKIGLQPQAALAKALDKHIV